MAAGQSLAQETPLTASSDVRKTPFVINNDQVNEQIEVVSSSPALIVESGNFIPGLNFGFDLPDAVTGSGSTGSQGVCSVFIELDSEPSHTLMTDLLPLTPNSLFDDLEDQSSTEFQQGQSFGGKRPLTPDSVQYPATEDVQGDDDDEESATGRRHTSGKTIPLPSLSSESSLIDSDSEDDCEADSDYEQANEGSEPESEPESPTTASLPRGGKHPLDPRGQYAQHQDYHGYEHPV